MSQAVELGFAAVFCCWYMILLVISKTSGGKSFQNWPNFFQLCTEMMLNPSSWRTNPKHTNKHRKRQFLPSTSWANSMKTIATELDHLQYSKLKNYLRYLLWCSHSLREELFFCNHFFGSSVEPSVIYLNESPSEHDSKREVTTDGKLGSDDNVNSIETSERKSTFATITLTKRFFGRTSARFTIDLQKQICGIAI